MSLRLKNNLHYLKALCKCKPAARKAILEHADGELINCICECIDNILKGNIKISKIHKKKLGRSTKVLDELRKKKTGLKRKKHCSFSTADSCPPYSPRSFLSLEVCWVTCCNESIYKDGHGSVRSPT